ncbi:unnamed protein product [Rhizopus stolonifer]
MKFKFISLGLVAILLSSAMVDANRNIDANPSINSPNVELTRRNLLSPPKRLATAILRRYSHPIYIEHPEEKLETKRAENEPDENEPDENEPDENEPDENEPDENEPDENEPDENEPDENEPDENEPDENEPDENEPDENEPDENEPNENEPNENEPDEKKPNEAISMGPIPAKASQEGQIPIRTAQ